MVAQAAERAAAPGPRLDRFLTSMLSEDEKKTAFVLGHVRMWEEKQIEDVVDSRSVRGQRRLLAQYWPGP